MVALLGLIPLHVGATLEHHLLHRHDVLEGMLPGVRGLELRLQKALKRRLKAHRSRAGTGAG